MLAPSAERRLRDTPPTSEDRTCEFCESKACKSLFEAEEWMLDRVIAHDPNPHDVRDLLRTFAEPSGEICRQRLNTDPVSALAARMRPRVPAWPPREVPWQ